MSFSLSFAVSVNTCVDVVVDDVVFSHYSTLDFEIKCPHLCSFGLTNKCCTLNLLFKLAVKQNVRPMVKICCNCLSTLALFSYRFFVCVCLVFTTCSVFLHHLFLIFFFSWDRFCIVMLLHIFFLVLFCFKLLLSFEMGFILWMTLLWFKYRIIMTLVLESKLSLSIQSGSS